MFIYVLGFLVLFIFTVLALSFSSDSRIADQGPNVNDDALSNINNTDMLHQTSDVEKNKPSIKAPKRKRRKTKSKKKSAKNPSSEVNQKSPQTSEAVFFQASVTLDLVKIDHTINPQQVIILGEYLRLTDCYTVEQWPKEKWRYRPGLPDTTEWTTL